MYLSYLHILSIISVIQVSLSLFNNKNHVDLSDYWKSGTWDIIEVPAYLNVNNNTGERTRPLYPAICPLVRAAAAAQMGSGLQHIILPLLEPCPCLLLPAGRSRALLCCNLGCTAQTRISVKASPLPVNLAKNCRYFRHP